MTNFDRAEQNFLNEDKEPKIIAYCEECEIEIFKGEKVYGYKNLIFCSEECAIEYFMSKVDTVVEDELYLYDGQEFNDEDEVEEYIIDNLETIYLED